MNKGLKRYIIKCIIFLMIPIIVFLSGCGNDAQADSSGIVENVEDDGVNVKYDEVTANHDEVGTPEPEVLNDSEESQINSDIDSETDAETDLNPMEIYEGFLEGEIMIEKEEEQVYIDELFWDNDIEYCFADIDSDGSEELHIRDSVIYYTIKVMDEKPQIMFEGWWGYEPVIADDLCGIFYYYHKYETEQIDFIRISADGSKESDGEFHWYDENVNGNEDIEDTFKKFKGWEDIDMEQYVQYREEHIAKQARNELEWTSRRLKNFTTWQEAYIDFVNKLHVSGYDRGDCEYSLIYVDDNDIPELFINTMGMVTGEIIVSFYEGKVRAINRDRCGMRYIEYGGLLYNRNGNMGFHPCNVYMLEKGEFSEIGTGWQSEGYIDEENVYWDYFWEGKEVTETEYEAHINELIDTSKCIEPPFVCFKDDILELLTNLQVNGL